MIKLRIMILLHSKIDNDNDSGNNIKITKAIMIRLDDIYFIKTCII